jgi:transcriptional regulator with XRE-family HTH domain
MNKIHIYIAATNTTVAELANRSGMDPSEIRRIANGKRKPGRRVRERIALAMRITLEELDADLHVFVARIRKSL